MRLPLSVYYITLNEEERLPESITKIKDWADEIIVVDSGSTDRTRNIAPFATGTEEIGHELLDGHDRILVGQPSLEGALVVPCRIKIFPLAPCRNLVDLEVDIGEKSLIRRGSVPKPRLFKQLTRPNRVLAGFFLKIASKLPPDDDLKSAAAPVAATP